MNIGVVSLNKEYETLFKESSPEYQDIFVKRDIQQLRAVPVHLQAILLDSSIVAMQDFEAVRQIAPTVPIFYKLTEVKSDVIMTNIKRFSATHRITLLKENLTDSQVVDELTKILFNKDQISSNRIISFFGTHSGAGVSTTTLNIAKALAERIHEKVLVLSLNTWDPADYFYEYRGDYLNDLKSELNAGTLSAKRLEGAVNKTPSFHHLAGNRDIKMQRYYKSHEIKCLIDTAKEIYDVILIDGGTHFDTACATQAYICSGLKFVVTTQEDKGYRGYFPYVLSQLIEPTGGNPEDFMLIVNQFQPDMSLISERDLEEVLEMSRIATIPHMNMEGSIAIRERKFLYDVASSIYREPIQQISNLIIAEGQLSEKPSSQDSLSKKGFFRLFTRKSEVGRV
ncbi:P-loop NTPase family protein [Bacillus swezeyi]|uniref:ParA family protein n=1 Tax=Bacillus swezeyi TaxID=1925020 RepID=UPI0016808102|nr:ParA family protein [Bacillus swezeyi]